MRDEHNKVRFSPVLSPAELLGLRSLGLLEVGDLELPRGREDPDSRAIVIIDETLEIKKSP